MATPVNDRTFAGRDLMEGGQYPLNGLFTCGPIIVDKQTPIALCTITLPKVQKSIGLATILTSDT